MSRCLSKQEAENKLKHLREIGILPSSIDEKIEKAKTLISDVLRKVEKPIIAFSGGKDSTVVLHLVRSINPNIVAVFENTTNEYPETVEYVRGFDNIVELHPEMNFWQCVKKYGIPGIKSKAKRRGNKCCLILKEKPAKKYCKENKIDLIFTGLTQSESRNRMMMLKRMGKFYWHKSEKLWKCHPISDWTVEDIWQYIKQNNLKYNPIYDMGIPRCGCRFCTAYIGWKKITNIYNPNDTKILLRLTGHRPLI